MDLNLDQEFVCRKSGQPGGWMVLYTQRGKDQVGTPGTYLVLLILSHPSQSCGARCFVEVQLQVTGLHATGL